MNVEAKSLYDEIILLLHKANPKDPGDYQEYITEKLEEHDVEAIRTMLELLARSKSRFRKEFDIDKLMAMAQSQREDYIKDVVSTAFDFPASEALLDAVKPIIFDVIAYYKDSHHVETAWDVVNEKAVDSLRTSTENVFTTLSDGMAQQVNNTIADTKEETHDLKDIASNVSRTFGDDVPVFDEDGNLIRIIPNDVWATMVARTEGTRAAAQAQYETLTSLGLEKFEYVAESQACDDCGEFDGNVYDLAELDSMIPQHPNCRCIAVPIMDELLSTQTDNDTSEE